MAEVTLTCDQCHKQIDVVEGTVCPGCECGSMKWTMTEFRQTAVEHIHVWTRRVPGQVVCLGCGAREERPPGAYVPELAAVPGHAPTVQRTCVDCGRQIDVPLDELCPQCPSCEREPLTSYLDSTKRIADECMLSNIGGEDLAAMALEHGVTPIVECCVCGYPTMGTRDDQMCSKCEVNEPRAAGKALVDAAVASPPPGVNQRAWRAALMALEEYGHGRERCLADTCIDVARVLVERYERERGR